MHTIDHQLNFIFTWLVTAYDWVGEEGEVATVSAECGDLAKKSEKVRSV